MMARSGEPACLKAVGPVVSERRSQQICSTVHARPTERLITHFKRTTLPILSQKTEAKISWFEPAHEEPFVTPQLLRVWCLLPPLLVCLEAGASSTPARYRAAASPAAMPTPSAAMSSSDPCLVVVKLWMISLDAECASSTATPRAMVCTRALLPIWSWLSRPAKYADASAPYATK